MNTKNDFNDTLLSYGIGLMGVIGACVLAFILKDSLREFINDRFVLVGGTILLLSGVFEHQFRNRRSSFNSEYIPDVVDRAIYIISFFAGSFLIFLGIL